MKKVEKHVRFKVVSKKFLNLKVPSHLGFSGPRVKEGEEKKRSVGGETGHNAEGSSSKEKVRL